MQHVEVVLPADVEEGEFDDRAKERTSEPGAKVKGLAHAVVSDLTEGRERRFGGNGAEVRLDGERLEQFGRAHGFGESEDAAGMILGAKKIEPLMDVIAFDKAIGCEVAAAGAVSACIRNKYGEATGEEELGVSCHADAIVAKTVEKNYCVTVTVMRVDGPGAEGDGVWCGNGIILKIGI